jgi:hypothetical protein
MIVAAAMTACNDNTHADESKSDTTVVAPMEQTTPDTTVIKMDTSASKASDSTKPKM